MGDTTTFEIQLGTCFYGGLEEDAAYVGRKPGDSGWISVCEEHKQQAESDGYELMEPKTEVEGTSGTGGDAPGGADGDNGGAGDGASDAQREPG